MYIFSKFLGAATSLGHAYGGGGTVIKNGRKFFILVVKAIFAQGK